MKFVLLSVIAVVSCSQHPRGERCLNSSSDCLVRSLSNSRGGNQQGSGSPRGGNNINSVLSNYPTFEEEEGPSRGRYNPERSPTGGYHGATGSPNGRRSIRGHSNGAIRRSDGAREKLAVSRPVLLTAAERQERDGLINALVAGMNGCKNINKIEIDSLKILLEKSSTGSLQSAVNKYKELTSTNSVKWSAANLPTNFCHDIVKNYYLLMELPTWTLYLENKEEAEIQTTVLRIISNELEKEKLDPALLKMLSNQSITASQWKVRDAMDGSIMPVLLGSNPKSIPRFIARCIGLTFPEEYKYHFFKSIVGDVVTDAAFKLFRECWVHDAPADFGDMDSVRASIREFIQEKLANEEIRQELERQNADSNAIMVA